jgi:hypothetical protein
MKFKISLAILVLVSSVPTFAQSTTYSYVGARFKIFGSEPCPSPACNITGSFTVSGPLLNLPWMTQISPGLFSFTDGNAVVTQTNASSITFFYVSTDASGNLVNWDMQVSNGPLGVSGTTLIMDNYSGSVESQSYNNATGTYALVLSPGAWTTIPANQSFVIESTNTEPSAGTATSSDPDSTVKCTVAAPCPQQLLFAFDTWNQAQATLGTPNALWGTNSIYDSGTGINLGTLCGANNSMFVVNGDGLYYNFFFTDGSNPCTSTSAVPAKGVYCLTFALAANCSGSFVESGPFSMYAYTAPSGNYIGTFNDTAGGHHLLHGTSGNDQINLTINTDFSVTSTLIMIPGDLCAAQTNVLNFTSTDPAAIAYAAYTGTISGIEVGDVTLTAMGDGMGDVLAVIIDDHDANGNVLPAGSLYITGTSIAGVCGSGYSFYDRPFSKRGLTAHPIPIIRRPHHRLRNRFERDLRERIDDREQLPSRLMIPSLWW